MPGGKAQYKLHDPRHIKKCLNVEKAEMLGNGLIESQFNDAPLMGRFSWKMFYSFIHH